MITTSFKPIYNSNSKVLILGSFPSVKSRENDFYYGNPQNRFWKLLTLIYNENILDNPKDKTSFLLNHKLALYDAIDSCSIKGSSDSTIENIVPSDLSPILSSASIELIVANGKKAYDICINMMDLDVEVIYLPSTSSANAQYSLERLIGRWSIIKNYK